MHEGLERVTSQVTSVSLGAAAVLIGPGMAGLAPSLPLAAVALGLALGVAAVRDTLPAPLDHESVRVHARTLWIGPTLAAAVLVLYMDLSPGELQTVGALIGLAGMANYLLRPVYALASGVFARVSRAA